MWDSKLQHQTMLIFIQLTYSTLFMQQYPAGPCCGFTWQHSRHIHITYHPLSISLMYYVMINHIIILWCHFTGPCCSCTWQHSRHILYTVEESYPTYSGYIADISYIQCPAGPCCSCTRQHSRHIQPPRWWQRRGFASGAALKPSARRRRLEGGGGLS